MFRELGIKTVRHHYTAIGGAKIQNTDKPNAKRMWGSKNSHSLLVGMQTSTIRKTAWQFLITLNRILSFNLATVLLGIYPNKMKSYVHTKTCTKMFTVVLLTTAKTWKQPRCPSVGEWINKLWSIQIMKS